MKDSIPTTTFLHDKSRRTASHDVLTSHANTTNAVIPRGPDAPKKATTHGQRRYNKASVPIYFLDPSLFLNGKKLIFGPTMNTLGLHKSIVDDYKSYISSFIRIADEDIGATVKAELDRGKLWPPPLIQFNPSFQRSSKVSDLCAEGILHPKIEKVFEGYQLYTHQAEALKLGTGGKGFIVTSGTGSGKSLTYLGTIFDHLFREGGGKGVRAVLVYPMNALINSQMEELEKFRENYEKHAQASFPIKFAAYTGQTKSELREDIVGNPPDILLTNYMMLELLLTRSSELPIRESINQALRFLIFDELHTYRGRQGADVSLLIRRIRANSAHPVTCIGTSATMATEGSLHDQQTAISDVGRLIFGEDFAPSQIIGETLEYSINSSHKAPTAEKLSAALEEKLPDHLNKNWIQQSYVCLWLERQIAIREADRGDGSPYLKRGTPRTLEDIAGLLAETVGTDNNAAAQDYLEKLLIKLQAFNEGLLDKGERNTILPYRLHQFFAQTGSVYATLERQGTRKITLEPGLYSQEGDRLFPHVFSRGSGATFICAALDQEFSRLAPVEFQAIKEKQKGRIVGYIIPDPTDGTSYWDPAADMDKLPSTWLSPKGERPKKDYAERFPTRIHYDRDGNYEVAWESALPNSGWFMRADPKGLLFDPSSGQFFDGNTNERTKLTTLGNEGRSTSTTVSAVIILKELAAAGFRPKDQKLLSFTDNRQDAALQSGHFNDFVRVARIRGAIAKALEEQPEGLDYSALGEAAFKHMQLSFGSYASADEDLAPFRRGEYEKTFKKLLSYLAIHDIRRGWRVILPNLERCGLLDFDYKDLDAACSWDEGWADLEVLNACKPKDRGELLKATLEHFRREFAIHLPALLEDSTLQENFQSFTNKLRPQWHFAKADDFAPSIIRIDPVHRADRRRSSTLTITSGFGKFLKAFLKKHSPGFELGREDYESYIRRFVKFLIKCDYLHAIDSKNPEGAPIKIYQLKLDKLIWKPGDHQHALADLIKQRSYKGIDEPANQFFRQLYLTDFSQLKNIEGADHTGQLGNDARLEREDRFRADWYRGESKDHLDEAKIMAQSLSALFCSPTMELGIDISQLSVVHMRNAPPNPANYAQRSGRAGRSGQGALVFTYCSSYSPHDRHYFANKEQLVAGQVDPPRLDLMNEELIESHLNAITLAEIALPQLKLSVTDLLNCQDHQHRYPLLPEIRDQLRLGAQQQTQIRERFLATVNPDLDQLQATTWFTSEWIDKKLDQLDKRLDEALNRWRELYHDSYAQLQQASDIIKSNLYKSASEEFRRAERQQKQSTLAMEQLRNEPKHGRGPSAFSEFYVFRYLASEGFLPGYNFTRLPVRVFVGKGDGGEFISRPRTIALREFGPRNIIYHEGDKYLINQIITSNPEDTLQSAVVCPSSGYWLDGDEKEADVCPMTGVDLTNSKNRELYADLIPLTESKAYPRDKITCEEEERMRLGFDTETYFSTSRATIARQCRINLKHGDEELLHLTYLPAARLITLNLGERRRDEKGFPLGLTSGIWHQTLDSPKEKARSGEPYEDCRLVKPYTHDTSDALYIEPLKALGLEMAGILSLQYALKRAMETIYQIEPSELGVTSLGGSDIPNILFYEAAEGSLGILSQIARDPKAFPAIVQRTIELCHYDDQQEGVKATYDDLLSYFNQPHHEILDRWLIKDALNKLLTATLNIQHGDKDYEAQYQHLLSTKDANSSTETQFLEYLYQHGLRLPDSAQKSVDGIYVKPDFFYEPDTWVFCDGTPHDDPAILKEDDTKRQAILDRGDELIVYYYKDDLTELVARYPDIFTPVK